MTDGMKVPPVIVVKPTCPGDQRTVRDFLRAFAKVEVSCYLLTCNLCQESHKSQVWLCFLILSFLSTSTCALSVRDLNNFQICLDRIKLSIEVREEIDAMLYAPSANDVKENCKKMSLKCYLLELKMVIEEEEIKEKRANCIIDFNDILLTEVGCPPCEAYSLRNITIFLNRLSNLLQELTVLENTPKT
ncbi:LOW QUALITY PROTEIN: interleukin-15 [Tautogolabrus adspersus]